MKERIELIQCDITKLEIDAVVNAANSSLKGGGGVDGVIHNAAGLVLHKECMQIIEKQGNCPTGEAVITSAGNMTAKYVIHAVGPVWNGGNNNERELLANAYKSSLKLAKENKVKTIAFPNISTGVYGFPKELAADIAIETVKNFLKKEKSIEMVIFACYDYENWDIYRKKLGA